jgi:hypothetical protein
MKFPAEFNEKVLQISYCDFLMFNCQVDFSKIKLDVISAWVTKRVTEILGFEDDVVINMVNSYLQGKVINFYFNFKINIYFFCLFYALSFWYQLQLKN